MFSNTLDTKEVDLTKLELDIEKRQDELKKYNDYYFFRYCVCLGLRAMGTIMGTFEFKLPGGVTINASQSLEGSVTI